MATSGWLATFRHKLQHLGIPLVPRTRSRRSAPGLVRRTCRPGVEELEPRLVPTTKVTEYSLPLPSGRVPFDITAGPDGTLWFTENGPSPNGNRIGHITTGGVIQEFTVPTLNSQPNDITVGPDGNLWFTEEFMNRIGMITTTG